MLRELVSERVRSRNLSVREASREIGISHVTLTRLLAGDKIDLDTVQSVANWMGISLATALGVYGKSPKMADTVMALIESEPRLAELFKNASEDLERGEITAEDLRDIIGYAAYRILGRKKVEQVPVHGEDR